MNECDNIKVFTNKLIDLRNQLKVHGEQKSNYQIFQKILISLQERFDSNVPMMDQYISINVPIKVGNGEAVMTARKGDINVMNNKGQRVIKDVFLVPGLEKHFLSVPQMRSRVYHVFSKTSGA